MFTYDNTNDNLCIPVASTSVNFLYSPEQFYQELMKRISNSKKRVVLAALYLGTGNKEKELIRSLQNALIENKSLKIAFLLDYFRGTRGDMEGSSTSLLKALIVNPNVAVSLFHTPEMRGIKQKIFTERINEVIGLQHMKFFVFDDSIIISGANLSDQYFVNRQDRYLLIENSPLLADFFAEVCVIISKHSMNLESTGELKFHGDISIHPITGLAREIQQTIKKSIDELYRVFKERILSDSEDRTRVSINGISNIRPDTFVLPFLQMGPFEINHEIQLLTKIFNNQSECLNITLMTAYFNLYHVYADLILRNWNFPMDIIFGSPKANGFYGASGLSGYIPALYAQNSLDFMKKVNESNQKNIYFKEWDRPNWTFHAKGLWINFKSTKKLATLVGSSNFGYRSAHRDLESEVLLVTENETLKRKITEERNYLLEYAQTLNLDLFLKRDHLIPTWVKYFSLFFKNFF